MREKERGRETMFQLSSGSNSKSAAILFVPSSSIQGHPRSFLLLSSCSRSLAFSITLWSAKSRNTLRTNLRRRARRRLVYASLTRSSLHCRPLERSDAVPVVVVVPVLSSLLRLVSPTPSPAPFGFCFCTRIIICSLRFISHETVTTIIIIFIITIVPMPP